jgi:hypothetical protein
MKDWPKESERWGNRKVEVRGSYQAFRNMVDRMSNKGTPRTSLYAYLEDDEYNQEEEKEEGEEKDSNQED